MSTGPQINKILIANRGEIAVRIIRSCRELGIGSVAVFSDADRGALHVRMADEAYRLGPAPSTESYLVQDRIFEIADRAGVDAIHPGYGFLSENASFAEACSENGFIFIGPDAHAIRVMGDKTAARAIMEKAGVPMAPGTADAIESMDEAVEIAAQIGFPILLKAAAGGGGKGMRIVSERESFSDAFEAAGREAQSAFGDGRIFLEKYITRPRHVEFQILADRHGNTVHLFERECSIQRRHQKVVEESPSVAVSEALRQKMGKAAVDAARSCSYVGAGTVEFLLDDQGAFYFMEMNTRLQVEHPVTEWITGLDLVAEQIRIAEGKALSFNRQDLSIRGHSIECRIYAEDPLNQFLPGPGVLLRHSPPDGPGIRVDAGVEQGDEVSIHYDPMISKLTVWGRDRKQAIDRMVRALGEYEIAGVPSTIPFCRYVMNHDSFRSGDFSTHFVQDHFNPDDLIVPDPNLEEALAHAAPALLNDESQSQSRLNGRSTNEAFSPWKQRRKSRK
jgi:acetyl-CoA carboxylase biotin carboxylase subunit